MRLSSILTAALIFSALMHSGASFAASSLENLFSVKKPVIAALFIQVAAGDDLNDLQKKQDLIDYTRSQMNIIKSSGVDGVLWEFRAGGILTPEVTEAQMAWMLDIMRVIVAERGTVQVGVELLWHYPQETLRLAAMCNAAFVRVDFFSDDMIADNVRVPIDPEGLIRYKNDIGAGKVVLFTDIQVKYATMVDTSISITQSAVTALSKGSYGVIVSGAQSGTSPDADRVRHAKIGAPDSDVIIGSGFSYQNAPVLLQHADGIIVGTSISVQTGGPLVPEKVAQLMSVVKAIRNQ